MPSLLIPACLISAFDSGKLAMMVMHNGSGRTDLRNEEGKKKRFVTGQEE